MKQKEENKIGYYTNYILDDVVNTKTGEVASKELALEMGTFLATHSDWFEPNEAADINDMLCGEDMKWYDWEHDMSALSRAYPDYGFILSGVGEEYDDRWIAYIKNGSVQFEQCQFVYNENTLW